MALAATSNFTTDLYVFGPKTYVRRTASPVAVTSTFHVTHPSGGYQLAIINDSVTSAVISVNGQVVLDPGDFKGKEKKGSTITRPVTLRTGNNSITVELRGKPGTSLTVSILRVSIENQAPISNAGADQQVRVGAVVQLDGSASDDADGDSLTYLWTLTSRPPGSTTALSDQRVVNPTFVADRPGAYVVELVVNDGKASSAADRVTITTQNSAPIANAGPDQTVAVNDLVQLTAAGSTDVDGDPLTYAWSIHTRPIGSLTSLADPTSVTPTFIPDVLGAYVLRLIVNDGKVSGPPDDVVISTSNSAPIARAGPDQTTTVGALVQLTAAGSTDVDGQALSYSWQFDTRPAGSVAVLSSATAVLPTFVADRPGTYRLELVVHDGLTASAPDTVTIATENSPPVADAGPDQTAPLDAHVPLNGGGSTDVDGNVLSFAWALLSKPSGSAAGLSDASNVTPTFHVDRAGTYIAQLIVHDGVANSAADTVIIDTRNSLPVANAGDDQTVRPGDVVMLDGIASTDVDGDALGYRWSFVSRPLQSAATLATPLARSSSFLADVRGVYVVQLVVNDGVGDSAPDTVVVSTANSVPIANAGPDQQVVLGGTVQLNGAASFDPDGIPLTYSWAIIARPPGSAAVLSDPADVYPTFQADTSGTFVAQLIVHDDATASTADTVMVNVGANRRPVAHAGPDQNVPAGTNVRLDGGSSSDPDGQALSYSWTLVSRPAGSAASLETPDDVITRFNADVEGIYIARLTVDDGTLTSADEITVTAGSGSPNQAPVVNAGGDQVTSLNTGPVPLAGSVTDDGRPAGSVLTPKWTVLSGPGSATFSAPGQLATTATLHAAGIYVLRLTVGDGELFGHDDVAILARDGINQAPIVNVGADRTGRLSQPLTIQGTVSDDGLPSGGAVTTVWTQVSGPRPALFSSRDQTTTTVVFSAPGTYVLRLTAHDQELSASDDIRIIVVPANGCFPAPPGLVSWWPGDGSAEDLAGGLDGSLGTHVTFGPAKVSAGFAFTALSTNRLESSVTVPHSPELSILSALTLEGWIFMNQRPTRFDWVIATKGPASFSENFGLYVRDTTGNGTLELLFEYYDGGNLRSVISQGAALSLNAFHHIAATADGNTVTFYVDGRLVSQAALTQLLRPNTLPLYVGYLDGIIDELSLYRRSLSAYEIEGIHAAGEAGKCREPLNAAPEVHAGPNRVVALGTASTLRGSVADDGLPAGSALTSTWSVVSGPGAVSFGSADQPVSTVTFGAPGTYLLRLTATDGTLTAADEATISVVETRPQNLAPVVTSAPVPTTRLFAGPRSTELADLTSWTTDQYVLWPSDGPARWLLRSATVVSQGGLNPDASIFVSDFPLFCGRVEGTLRVEIADDDDIGFVFGYQDQLHLYRFNWRAANQDNSPVGMGIFVVQADSPLVGDEVEIESGNRVRRLFGNSIPWVAGRDYRYTVEFLPGFFKVTVYDGPAQLESVTIADPTYLGGGFGFYNHSQPLAVHSAMRPTSLCNGSYGYQLVASDPNQDVLTYSLDAAPPGMVIDPSTGFIGWVPTFADVGTHQIVARAQDPDGLFTIQSYTLEVLPPNRPPTISSQPSLLAQAGVTYAYAVSATDPDQGDLLAYSLIDAPEGMTISPATGLLQWTPTPSQIGTHRVRLAVTDQGGLNPTQVFQIVVKATPVPRLTGVSPNTGRRGETELAVTITGEGTHFSQGATQIHFGSGILVSDIVVLDTAHISARLAIDLHAALGARAVTVTTGEESVSLPNAFTIESDEPVNRPPVAHAGDNQTVTLPGVAFLAGAATDDGVPQGSPLTYAWSQIAGPGTVTFADASIPLTTASFSAQGIYTLRLTVGDSMLFGTDDVVISVEPAINSAPHVSAGADQTVTLPSDVTLTGVATDDGRPEGSNLAFSWHQLSGPAPILAENTQEPALVASFTAPGTYVIRLVVSDTELQGSDDVVVTVNPSPNRAPAVNAGPDQAITLPAGASLSGTVTDDGLPAGAAVSVHWTQVSGPGTATFSSPNQTATAVTFSTAGTYVLRLTVSDTALSTFDDVVILARPPNQAPTADAGPDLAVTLPANVTIAFNVTDDGRPAGGALTVEWTTVSGPGVALFSGRTPTAITVGFDTPGTYVLRLTATDTEFTVTDDVTVTVSGTAAPPPTLFLTSPSDGADITTFTNVVGTVSSPALVSWALEMRTMDEPSFRRFAGRNSPVLDGTLGVFDPTLLLNGVAQIRMSAVDTSGRSYTTPPVGVIVTKNQKVGNFTVSFNDLTVPVAGFPIQVARTYDSRDKRSGDFGFGWSLDLKTVRLHETVVPGSDWIGTRTDAILPTFCVHETKAHVVSVTLTDGTVYQFKPVLTPQCQLVAPIEEVTVAFIPLPGTVASLAPIGVNRAQIADTFPGPLTLLDLGSLATFNPDVYLLTLPDGRALHIDQHTGLRRMEDLHGNTLTVSNEGITHSSGKGVTFVRDGIGRIAQVVDPAGNVMSYGYDPNGDLVTFRDRGNQITTYGYNAAHGLVTIDDPRGIRPIRNEYDASGRLLKHVDAFGNEISYTHDLSTRQQIVQDRLGHITVNEYDSGGNVVRVTDALGGVTERTYDSRDNLLSETNALGHTRTYTYDERDNRLTETDPLRNTTTYTYNDRNQVLTVTDALGHRTTNEYDARGNLTKVVDASGHETVYTYNAAGLQTSVADPLGFTTTSEYDPFGNLTKQIDALGHATTYTYDENGNRLTENRTRTTAGSSEMLVTRFEHDAAGRLFKTIFPDGSITEAVYNAIGKQSLTVDQLLRTTRYEYDAMGRLTQTTFPDGSRESSTYDAEGRRRTSTDRAGRTTTYEYDPLGQLTKTIYADSTSTSTTYNAIGQVTAVTDARDQSTLYEYDDAGRRTKVTDALGHITTFGYDVVGNQTSMTDANGRTTEFEYDGNNRRTKVEYPDGSSEETAYDPMGRTVSKRDQAGFLTRYEYDPLGRLTAVVDAKNQVTRYGYDEVWNRVSQTDANDHTTEFVYDRMGRRMRRILPLGMAEHLTYDPAGNLVSKIDFNGHTTTYTYDELNRLTSKIPLAARREPTVSFAYTATSQRAQMVDASGTTTYAYDPRDRLVQKITPQGTLTYTYDAAGNLASIRSSNTDGTFLDYSYDSLNRLSTVTDNRLSPGVTTYTYDNVGNVADFTYPNGVTHTYAYNLVNRLTDLTVMNTGGTVASYRYTLAPAGNRTRVVELDGRTLDYTYDELYRLASETISGGTVNGTIGYDYDRVGNRVARTSTVSAVPPASYAYDANDRLVTDTYDSNGNTIVSGGNTHTYDFENRLLTVNGGAITILYDGDGNRVAKTTGGITTGYLVDDRNLTGVVQVIEELVGRSLFRVYTYGLDLISQTQDSVRSFYGYDGHGSVRLLTDTASAVTDRYDYDAFGNVIRQTGMTPNVYLYSGEQSDPQLRLYFLRARYLNMSSGRFVSMDRHNGSLPEPLSLHQYLYANADPVNRLDPSGLYSITDAVLGGISAAFTTAFADVRFIGRGVHSIFRGFAVDSITERNLEGLNIGVRVLARTHLFFMKRAGLEVRITQGFRTFAEQDALYAIGRTLPGKKVTYARGGESYHNFGLAYDISLFRNNYRIYLADGPEYDVAGRLGRMLGLTWGGNFRTILDKPHFQLSYGLSTDDLTKLKSFFD